MPESNYGKLGAKDQYFSEIDGLRAVAVIAVIVNHFNDALLQSGYLGVDIFFVISGYVITLSLSRSKELEFGRFIRLFYERRTKRLVPALAVCVLITSILISLFNPDPAESLSTGIWSLWGLSNLQLLGASTDYFAQATELNPFTHTWSLGVEEQFYFLFPFLFWFTGFGRKSKRWRRVFLFIIIPLAVASLLAFVLMYERSQSTAYFLMPTRFWEIAVGCIAFVGFAEYRKIQSAASWVAPSFVLALIVLILFLPLALAVPATVSVVILTAVLILSLRQSDGSPIYKLLSSKPFVFVGAISYSLYLWHWPVLSISRWTVGVSASTVPFQLILIFLLSIGSYFLIEKPVRYFKKVSGPGWLLFALGSLAASTLFIDVARASLLDRMYLGRKSSIPYGTTKSGSLARESCVGDSPDAKPQIFENCIIKGGRPGSASLYLVGDSHALALFPFLEELNKILKINVAGYSVPLASFPAGLSGIGGADQLERTSRLQVKVEAQLVSRLKPGDWIAVSNANYPLSADQQSKIETAFDSLGAALSEKGARGIIFLPIPEFSNSAQCVRQWFQSSCVVSESRPDLERSRQSAVAMIRRIQAKYPNVIYTFDPLAHLCAPALQECNIINRDLGILFFDYSHLNVGPSRALAHPFADFLKRKSLKLV